MLSRPWQWLQWVVAMLVGLSSWPVFRPNTHADEPASVPGEYQAKAAFLLNFTKFINWPPKSFATSDAPFVVGVLGDNPFGTLLAETLRGESVKGRKVELRYFPSIVQNFESSHLLFISRSETAKFRTIFRELRGQPVLVVGESEGFVQSGGMINFVAAQDGVGFEINTEAAERVGFTISSKLLDLPKAAKGRAARPEP
jgi:hypothetical protein